VGLLFAAFRSALCTSDSSLDLERIVITKSDIHLNNSYSIGFDNSKDLPFNSPVEFLSSLPIDLQSRNLKDGIQTDFSLRGSNYQGVLLLFDGQRINDPQTGHHNSDIPLTCEDVEKIEVVPGAGSSLFGPDAIGGAVNFILRKPEKKKIILEVRGGQHKTWSGLFSMTEKINNLGLRLSVENAKSDGFRYDTDFKKFTTNLSTSLDIPDGEFNLDFGYQEKEFGAYDFYTPNTGYPSKEWTKTWLLSTGLNLDKYGFMIKPNFLWRRHYDKFMLDKTNVRSRYLSHHHTNIYTPNIYFQKEINRIGKIGLGLEYGEEDIDSTTLNRHNRKHKSLFTDASRDFSEQLATGLSFRADDFDGFGKVYTGSANFRYKLNKNNALRLGISRSMRIPSFTELYYNDPTTLGNSTLLAEKSLNYELGYDYKKETISTGMLFFFRREKDFIDWIKRTPSQAKWQTENIANSDVFGVENYFRLRMSGHLNLEGNYTYIDKYIESKDFISKYGPNYAKHLVNSAFNLAFPFGTQSISFTYKKKPNRAGWFLLDAHLAYKINKHSKVFLNATNLLNVGYQEIEGIPQPGRWVEGGLRLEW
jgi:iron complex outermembrane receptor protein